MLRVILHCCIGLSGRNKVCLGMRFGCFRFRQLNVLPWAEPGSLFAFLAGPQGGV